MQRTLTVVRPEPDPLLPRVVISADQPGSAWVLEAWAALLREYAPQETALEARLRQEAARFRWWQFGRRP